MEKNNLREYKVNSDSRGYKLIIFAALVGLVSAWISKSYFKHDDADKTPVTSITVPVENNKTNEEIEQLKAELKEKEKLMKEMNDSSKKVKAANEKILKQQQQELLTHSAKSESLSNSEDEIEVMIKSAQSFLKKPNDWENGVGILIKLSEKYAAPDLTQQQNDSLKMSILKMTKSGIAFVTTNISKEDSLVKNKEIINAIDKVIKVHHKDFNDNDKKELGLVKQLIEIKN